MDFSKPPHGLMTPMSPPKHALPAEDDAPAGSDWDMEQMTIGPAKNFRPGSPNPMEVQAPGIDTGTSLLAEQLNWQT